MKKVFIQTLGCQMNARDSEVIKGLLVTNGYQLTEDPALADVILFNTCSVRQHAEDKVWSEVGRYAVKRKEPRATVGSPERSRGAKSRKPVLGIIGCMAQNYKEDIFKKAPSVDIVCGPSEIGNIALYVEEALRRGAPVVAVSERKRRDAIYHTGFYEGDEHAYVVISEGCDNFCSYCVVPYVRGRLRHRDVSDILKEVRAAIAGGITRMTLLGQNVNSYQSSDKMHRSSVDFVGLLRRVCDCKGLKSLSFITSHPKDVKRELFALMAERPVIRRYLHLPVQSGSDKILAAMNRGYTVRRYLELVDEYRSVVYNGQLSTDIIVGFPKETRADFEQTRLLCERVRFDSAYLFKYSPRPHTRAAELDDNVPLEEKKRRHAVLLALQKKIFAEKKQREGV